MMKENNLGWLEASKDKSNQGMATVLPMQKILQKRFPDMPVDFWGEEEMKPQYHGVV